MLTKVLCWKMVSKIVGMVAISRKENVPGVDPKDCAVEEDGMEMDVTVTLEVGLDINVSSNWVNYFSYHYILL